MGVTLGGLSLDTMLTSVKEEHEEVGGRDSRKVELCGVVIGETSVDAIEAQLDAILDASSCEDYGAELLVRDGRRLWARRNSFKREVQQESLVGAFTLVLEARNPYEESVSETEATWEISGSPSSMSFTAGGTMDSLPIISLTALGAIVTPVFSDGERSISYEGIVPSGSTLVVDCASETLLLDGADVSAYGEGAYPRIDPAGTTLNYSDDALSSHLGTADVAYRDRWW